MFELKSHVGDDPPNHFREFGSSDSVDVDACVVLGHPGHQRRVYECGVMGGGFRSELRSARPTVVVSFDCRDTDKGVVVLSTSPPRGSFQYNNKSSVTVGPIFFYVFLGGRVETRGREWV